MSFIKYKVGDRVLVYDNDRWKGPYPIVKVWKATRIRGKSTLVMVSGVPFIAGMLVNVNYSIRDIRR